jgi:hypothetical protein
VPYNGTAHTATGSAKGVNDEDLSSLLDLTGTTHTDAGEYADTWTFAGNTNYKNAGGPVVDKISKVDATITVTGYDVPYNGTAHTATGSAKGVNDEDLSSLLDLTGTTHTDAGEYADTWTFAGNTNYKNASGPVADKISKVDAIISVIGYDVTYSGSTHTASGSAKGVNDEDLSSLLDLTGTTHTDAGEYADTWTFTGNMNYKNASGPVADKIGKAPVTVSVICNPTTVTYTGSAQTPCSASATGAGGLNQTLTVDYSNNTNAGTANASASYAESANHLGNTGSATFTIAKAPVTVSVVCSPATVTYNGDPQTPCSASVMGAGGLNQTLTVGYSNNTNAGTATASATYAEGANHLGNTGSTTFTIAKADATISVTGYTGVYDGNEHGAYGSAAGVKGENLTSLLDLGNKYTNVPGGTANWIFSGNTNYNGASGSVEIVIRKWSLRGFYQPVGETSSVVSAPGVVPAVSGAVWNTIKGGQTVPLKFNIYRGEGGALVTSVADGFSAPAFSVYQLTSCSAVAAEDAIEGDLSTGGTELRWDGTQFIQNWKTPKVSAEACFRAVVTAKDGSTITAFFKVKK